MKLLIDRISSEIGQLLIVTDGENLCALEFEDCESRMLKLLQARFDTVELIPTENPQGFSQTVDQYLKGDLHTVDQVPVNPGGTPFQQKVWSALRTIPVGATVSYKELATQIGQPTASRAVGMANSQNPIAIAIPCHRVIGAKSKLTGYAGGLERKKWLLSHEGVSLEQLST
ncbi:MAG: methylated-DNA--[protein]-cysteine S-methyltransferase [Microcoleaceae cyanobacterium]